MAQDLPNDTRPRKAVVCGWHGSRRVRTRRMRALAKRNYLRKLPKKRGGPNRIVRITHIIFFSYHQLLYNDESSSTLRNAGQRPEAHERFLYKSIRMEDPAARSRDGKLRRRHNV